MAEKPEKKRGADHLRDYCTAAFRFYARWGGKEAYVRNLVSDLQRNKGQGICSPTESELIHREQIMREHFAEIADLEAVETVLSICDQFYPDIKRAVEYVYLDSPFEEMEWGDIKQRVHYAEIHMPASERNIYYWLKRARMIFAEQRGLRMKSLQ